jgi:hypothetical protein
VLLQEVQVIMMRRREVLFVAFTHIAGVFTLHCGDHRFLSFIVISTVLFRIAMMAERSTATAAIGRKVAVT